MSFGGGAAVRLRRFSHRTVFARALASCRWDQFCRMVLYHTVLPRLPTRRGQATPALASPCKHGLSKWYADSAVVMTTVEQDEETRPEASEKPASLEGELNGRGFQASDASSDSMAKGTLVKEDYFSGNRTFTPESGTLSALDGQLKPGHEPMAKNGNKPAFHSDEGKKEQSSVMEQSEKDRSVSEAGLKSVIEKEEEESRVKDSEPKDGKLKEKLEKKSKKHKDKTGKDAAMGSGDEKKAKKWGDMVDEERAGKGKEEIDSQSRVDDKDEDKQMRQEKDAVKDKKAEKKGKDDEEAKKEKKKSENDGEQGEGEKKKEKKEKKNKGSAERIQIKLEKINAKIGRILAKKEVYVLRLKEAQEKDRREAENRAPKEREESAAVLGKPENDKAVPDWRSESLTEEECRAKLEEGPVEVVQKQPSGSLSRTHSVVPPPPEEEELAGLHEVLKDLPDFKITDDSEQADSGLHEVLKSLDVLKKSDDCESKHAPQSDHPVSGPLTAQHPSKAKVSDASAEGKERNVADIFHRHSCPGIAGALPIEPLFLGGPVIKGFGRGSKVLGIPTANLSTAAFSGVLAEHVCGIYLGWAGLSDRGIYKTVMSVGYNPYFANAEKTVEPWLLHDFPEDFYGEELRLVIAGYIRPESNFPSLEALIARIHEDGRVAEKALDVPPYKDYGRLAYLSTPLQQP